MGKRGSDSVLQKSAKKSRELEEIAVSPETMGKGESDSVLQRSAKKYRELKDLGPTVEELEYGCESPDGPRTLPRLGLWMDSDDEEHWKQNRQSYSSDDEDNTFSPEDEADYCRQCFKHGETGLQYYNKKNRTNYELVDALGQVVFLDDAIWVHCNFTAKPQMKPNGDMDAQAQLFFAEMHYSNSLPKQVIVVTCRLLKEGKTKTSDACLSCGGPRSLVAHPTNGFRRGYSDLEARTLRPRSRR